MIITNSYFFTQCVIDFKYKTKNVAILLHKIRKSYLISIVKNIFIFSHFNMKLTA